MVKKYCLPAVCALLSAVACSHDDHTDTAAPFEAAEDTAGAPTFDYAPCNDPLPLDDILDQAPERNPYDDHLPDMPDDGCVKMKINPVGGTLAQVFCDSNYLHLEAAQALGIDPIHDSYDAWHLRRPLVRVESCPQFVVSDLTHSYPYLVPEAADFLTEVGDRFNAALKERGGGSYRLKVTSLLRTATTVNKLKRRNRNATDMSAHLFGTTFDISYAKFICDGYTVNRTQEDLKNLLAEVLYELREEGRCYVKYEKKQGCFHVTTRPPASVKHTE